MEDFRRRERGTKAKKRVVDVERVVDQEDGSGGERRGGPSYLSNIKVCREKTTLQAEGAEGQLIVASKTPRLLFTGGRTTGEKGGDG